MTLAVAPRQTAATLSVYSDSAAPTSRRDEQILQWANGQVQNSIVSRRELVTYAQELIVSLTRLPAVRDGGIATPVVKRYAALAIDLTDILIDTDNLATPQITPMPDGGIEVEWLVCGNHMGFSFSDEGFYIWGDLANGSAAFASFESPLAELARPSVADDFKNAVVSANNFLVIISREIKHRLSIR